MEMIMRGTAQAVPLSVWANCRFPWNDMRNAQVPMERVNYASNDMNENMPTAGKTEGRTVH